jgi:serine/threonine-protein kinase
MGREHDEPPWDEDPDETSVTRRMPRADEEYGYVEAPVVEEEVVEPPPRRPPTLWPWLLALLALVLIGLGALWYFTRDDDEPELVPVPAAVRLPEGDAVQLLRDAGFQVEIEREPTDEAPQGIVFEQTPGAGREAEEGSVVTIVVSRGPETAEVPDVTGVPRERAEELLASAGFRANVAQVFSEEDPGTVVAQDPAGGERAPLESNVRINVSKGTNRVEVPDVVGLSAADAGAELRSAGLATPNVVTVPSDAPANEVVAQSPAAGTEVQRGATVRINVSSGRPATTAPETAPLPDVVGLTEDEATQALQAVGAAVVIEREDVTDPAEDGIVLSQEPGAGEEIADGDRVEIVVGRLTP